MKVKKYIIWLFLVLLISGCHTTSILNKEWDVEFSWDICKYKEKNNRSSERPTYKLIVRNSTKNTLRLPANSFGDNWKAKMDALVKLSGTLRGTFYVAYELDTIFLEINDYAYQIIKPNIIDTFYLYPCGMGNKSTINKELCNLLWEKGTMYLDYNSKNFKKKCRLVESQKIGFSKKE